MTTSVGSGAWRQAASKALVLFEGLDADVLGWLADDPIATIESLFDLTVDLSDDIPDKPSSVPGHYYPRKARIVIERALSDGRTRFTALHELAHHLIRQHDALSLELKGPPPKSALEEAICDSFAGRVLIPDELVDQVIPETGPTASDVVALWQAGTASRSAAAVRAAEHLGASGHVMIASTDGVAQFTATRGIEYVVAPGAQQHNGVVRRAGKFGRGQGTDHVTYRTGNASEEFHVDAVREGDYVFAVFTTGHASWERLHILQDRGFTPDEVVCPHCHHSFEAWRKHADCWEPECPSCGRCGCHRRQATEESVCSRCFCLVAAHLIVEGVCDDCR